MAFSGCDWDEWCILIPRGQGVCTGPTDSMPWCDHRMCYKCASNLRIFALMRRYLRPKARGFPVPRYD